MAPTFTKLLGTGAIAGDFQDKLPTDLTLMSLKQLLKPLRLINDWSKDLEAEDTPTIQLVIPAMVQLCNLTKEPDYQKCASRSTQKISPIF
jgi:hypothetical protein